MDENLSFWMLVLGICGVVVACYPLAKWLGRQRTLWVADRITRSFASQDALATAGPALRHSLERYRLAAVRARLGAHNSLHATAAELVREHRLHLLERR